MKEQRRLNKVAIIGLVFLAAITLIAIFAPLIAPHNPLEQNLELALMMPCREYPFGTDEYGRCVFSRMVYGAGVSLRTGVIVTLISSVIGVTLGLISGYFGGPCEFIVMRMVDIFLAFPGLILALVVAGFMEPDLKSAVLALSFVGWMGYTRIVRSIVLTEKEKEYVETAKALGAGHTYILFRYMLPAVASSVIVMVSMNAGRNILAAAGLNFLGIGVQPPNPEWGSMLNAGKDYMSSAPYLTIFPGLGIVLTTLSFNVLGDGLRDFFDRTGYEIER